MKKLHLILPVVLIMILAACATPPTEEMNRAKDAVTRAESDANAVAYAPTALTLARDALTRMQNESDAKRYEAAKNFAEEAIRNAERAIAEGRSGAGRAKEEAESLINSLPPQLAETSNSLNAAKEVQGIQLDFAVLQADLESAYRTYDDARQSLQVQNYTDAIMHGQTVRSVLAGINGRLTGGAVVASRKQ